MPPNAVIWSLPVALIGLYYFINAGGGGPADEAEGRRINRVRARLRRTNGLVMVAMGVVLYLAISRSFPLPPPGRGVGLLAPLAWLATLPLLLAMVVLALLDVRLTRALRKDSLRRAAIDSAKREAADQVERERVAAEARQWAEQADRAAGGGDATPNSKAVAAVLLLAGAVLAGGAVGCEPSATTAPATTAATSRASAPATAPADPEPDRDARSQNLPRAAMKVGDAAVWVQVADDEAKRETGLMYRRKLGDDEGMLFVFPDSERRGFWMRNTFVPLDIAFADAKGRVLNVERMLPRDERSTYSAGAARYALELPAGAARRLGIKAGTMLELPAGSSGGE